MLGAIMKPKKRCSVLAASLLGILWVKQKNALFRSLAKVLRHKKGNLMQHVWICGDSILRGVVWSPEAGRYMTTKEIGYDKVEERFHITLNNRSRFGCTLEKGADHLFRTLDRGEPCDVAILEYGGNDADFNWAEISATPDEVHLSRTSPDDFEALYRKTVRRLREKGILAVLCSVIPVCSGRYLDWVSRDGLSRDNILHWLGEEDVIFRYQAEYSRRVEKLAREEGLPLIDLRASFMATSSLTDYYCLDGIHPNEKGQHLIRDTLLQVPESVFDTSGRGAQTPFTVHSA